MNSNNYDSIMEYLKDSYEDGFISTMYSLQKQGIPLIIPLDQDMIVKAIQTDSKLSQPLYQSMGINTNDLKKTIRNEISRGISNGYSYQDIARNIGNSMNVDLNKSIRIARTEGHRVNQQSTYDGMSAAKNKGADIVKQWDATLDFKTRVSHQRVDGEIKELGESFSNGLQFPGDPGGPAAEVINCRCVLLQRAKWALDEDELKILQDRAEYFGIDKSDNFNNFKSNYLKIMEENNILMDEKTPCLRRLSDNKIVDTNVVKISPKASDFKDWEFDWTIPEKNGYNVFALKAEGDNRIQGMVALKPDFKDYKAMLLEIVESAPFNNPHNKLFVEKEYEGVGGHLFAEAVKQSYENGLDGYVFFKAKSNLVQYYQEELNAILINSYDRTMMIDERGAKELYDRYYKEK